MNKAVFTIVTESHIPNAITALGSYVSHMPTKIDRYIFYISNTSDSYTYNINAVNIINISATDEVQNLKQKGYNDDCIRWSLKPFYIKQILQNKNYDECTYIDSDIYFVDSILEIENNTESILLSPHNRPWAITEVYDFWKINDDIGDINALRDGYFNGGFIFCKKNTKTLNAIDWWKRCCFNKCEINYNRGLYVDQKYLEYMYFYFNLDMIKDLGCNIAIWNIYCFNIVDIDWQNYKFNITPKNIFNTDERYTPKFFHFSGAYNSNYILKHFARLYEKDIEIMRMRIDHDKRQTISKQ